MKKMFAMLMALTILMTMAACGQQTTDEAGGTVDPGAVADQGTSGQVDMPADDAGTPELQIRQILVKDQRDGDVLYFNFVFAQQEQNQIQRPLEIFQRLAALGLHHPFQLKDQIVQRFCSSEADDAAE